MNSIKWIFEHMKGKKRLFFLGMFLQNCVILPLAIISPVLTTKIVDEVFYGGVDDYAMLYLGLFLLTRLVSAVSQYIKNVSLDAAAAHALANFRTHLYKKLQDLSPSFYSKNRTGDIMMRLTGDLEMMRHFVAWVISTGTYAVIIFIAGLVVFYYTNALLATIMLIMAPIFIYLVLDMRKKGAPAHRRSREMTSQLNAMVQENISANRVVKAFVREEFEQEKFERHNEAYRDAATYASSIWATRGPLFGVLSNLIMVLTLIIGGIMVIYGKTTIGSVLLFYNLNWIINESMRLIGMVINDGQRFFSSTQKVMQLYYAPSDITNPDNPYYCGEEEESGRVEFKNVSFAYDGKNVLEDISLVANPGETIGIMGPTGSGKSTLAMLMSRFADVKDGSILIDGVDVKKYDLASLRSKLGISMQDVFLFSNTIDSNIAYGRPDIGEDEVIGYAKMADAHGFIERMPDGYDTIVGERGVGLSGGQKQRIALARALAFESPIVVLDDTTSAVDMETEKYIQGQLEARQGKHTTFIVAQRISSVKNADKIYIIDNGRISEEGTHSELLAKKGYYYDIYCLQQGIAGEQEVENNG